MSHFVRMMMVLSSLVLLAGSVGCQEKAAAMNKPDQSGQAAADRIHDLQMQLEKAQHDRAATEAQLVALQNELNDLKRQMAERPAAAPGWNSVPGGAMISIDGTVLFDSGKTVLKPSAKKTLDQVARTIKEKYADRDVYVFGHTDNMPIRKSGWHDNYELSCERSLAVVRFLRSAGVDQNAAAAGWGDQLPVADNSKAASRQANRRVEIFAMTPQKTVSGTASSTPPRTAGRTRS